MGLHVLEDRATVGTDPSANTADGCGNTQTQALGTPCSDLPALLFCPKFQRVRGREAHLCAGDVNRLHTPSQKRKTHADNSAAVSGCNSGENSDARSQSERVLGAFLSGDNVITSYKYNLSVSI